MFNHSQMTTSRPAPPLFETPPLDERELAVLAEIDGMRQALRFKLGESRRWNGSLRRTTLARNIQGSNSIEGYDAPLDDADAVVLGEDPLDADTETRLALEGYRTAMTYVLQLAQDDDLTVSADLIKSLHFMMTSYDLSVRPGRWRAGPIYVQREYTGEIVHEGADLSQVPKLMSALVAQLGEDDGPALIRAAMAHLNLVMIHPFRDGNGRMARCLQSLVLASDGGSLSPVFLSIEEHLGRNTQTYYDVLGQVGGGSWQPDRDARPWIRFTLTAHLRQAQTIQRRIQAIERVWVELERLTRDEKLAERTIYVLVDATLGYRVRRATYMAALAEADEAVSEQTATRDLAALADAGLLLPQGDKRGRTYIAGDTLRSIADHARRTRAPKDFSDPFGTG
ncbi:Fic family protein [Agromyces protaetiae]|nr:Fic family protein [Agromyces protaetiae]